MDNDSGDLVPSVKRKRKRHKDGDAIENIDKQLKELLENDKEEQDEAYYSAMSWAVRFRKLSSYQQTVFRQGLEKLFFKCEYETPDTYSPQ